MTQHEHASKSQDAAHSARRQVTPERTAAKDAEKPLAEHIAASPIQAKLAVSSPVDASEREADLMAATVMRRIEVEIQRQEEEEVQTKLARQEEEEEVQMKAGTSPGIVADGLEARINTARGSGSAIEPGVKSELEPAFGYDFSGFDRTIDVHILNLRRKLEPDPNHPKYILTVYAAGYKFCKEL